MVLLGMQSLKGPCIISSTDINEQHAFEPALAIPIPCPRVHGAEERRTARGNPCMIAGGSDHASPFVVIDSIVRLDSLIEHSAR
jgi:hypothetical protein